MALRDGEDAERAAASRAGSPFGLSCQPCGLQQEVVPFRHVHRAPRRIAERGHGERAPTRPLEQVRTHGQQPVVPAQPRIVLEHIHLGQPR